MPVTGQLASHFRHGPTGADLDRCPLRGSGREQAVLRRDAVVLQHEGASRTGGLDTDHAVLLPRQAHRIPIDRQIDVAHHRTLFDLGGTSTIRTSGINNDLFDDELDIAPASHVGKDADVLQTYKRGQDFTSVSDDEGASLFVGHTSSLKCLRRLRGDTWAGDPR